MMEYNGKKVYGWKSRLEAIREWLREEDWIDDVTVDLIYGILRAQTENSAREQAEKD